MPDKVVSRENLKAFREKLDDKYVIEGEYSPSTSVGLSDEAENLTPYGDNSGASDQSAFRFQTTGVSSDVGALAYQKKLLGNTVAFNQLIQLSDLSDRGLTNSYTSDGLHTITGTTTTTYAKLFPNVNIINGHKYLIRAIIKTNSNNISFRFKTLNANIYVDISGTGCFGDIVTANISVESGVGFEQLTANTNVGTISGYFLLTDLTLLGAEYSTVLAFNRDYPLPYYSYNAGQLLSSQTKGIKNVGYNAYDNANPNNYIMVVAGQKYTLEGSGTVALYDGNKNLLDDTFVSESALPNYCHYVKITSGDETTCFHLTWDGSRIGYEPYQVHEYAMPNIELRSAGSVYDELKPDGTLIRRVGVVDLGTLTVVIGEEGSNYERTLVYLPSDAKVNRTNDLGNMTCSKYTVTTSSNTYLHSQDKIISINDAGTLLQLYDSSLVGMTADQRKTALSGVYLVYELATPTTAQNDAYKFQEVQQVDDFGTQEALSDQAIQVPQGFDFFYPVDYKAFLDSLGGREDIEYDATQIVSQEQLGASETQRDTIDNQLKEALGGTLRQCLCVKESLDFNNTAWVDLGTLSWTDMGSNTHVYWAQISDIKVDGGVLCSSLMTVPQVWSTYTNNAISSHTSLQRVYAKLTDSIIDANQFKTAMKGVLLAYEKAS